MSATLRRILLLTLALAPFIRPAYAQSPADAGNAPSASTPAPAQETLDTDSQPSHRHRHHGSDRVNLGGSVEVKEGETVDDAVGVGGSVTVAGHVTGDAVAVGGTLHLARTARVEGDAVAVGGTLDVEDGAVVAGQRVVIGPALGLTGLGGILGALGAIGLAWTIATMVSSVLGLIALGALCVAFIPDRLERMKRVLERRVMPSEGVGALAALSVIPVSILLVVTIVGILVLPFLWMFLGLAMLLGLVIVAQLIGERLPLGPRFHGPFATLAIGALLLTLVRLVPVIGSISFVMATLAGTGAVLLSRGGAPSPRMDHPMSPFGTPDIAPAAPPPPVDEGPVPQ